jgi:hypothetical protein
LCLTGAASQLLCLRQASMAWISFRILVNPFNGASLPIGKALVRPAASY